MKTYIHVYSKYAKPPNMSNILVKFMFLKFM